MRQKNFIPHALSELIDERIKFCQAQLRAQGLQRYDKAMMILFENSLNHFIRLKEMLALIRNASNAAPVKIRFKELSKKMLCALIDSAADQMNGLKLYGGKNTILYLLDGLKKIYKEVDAM